jgi:hypothetical protein
MGCDFAEVCEVVSQPGISQSGRLRHSSASLVDFRGRRAAAFLLCPLMCKIWAFRYFWPYQVHSFSKNVSFTNCLYISVLSQNI